MTSNDAAASVTASNREAWLRQVADRMAPAFAELGFPLPSFRAAIGWPSASHAANGECWDKRVSGDGHFEIFISPGRDDSRAIAATLAHAGKRVLLIDADLRKGHLQKLFGLPREGGLSELLAGDLTVQQAVHASVLPHLDVLTTGRLPVNPADLLMSDTFVRVLDALSAAYDLVIVDTPPVLVAAK